MPDERLLGVVGLGDIGAPIVRTLLRSGVRVVGFDLREDALTEAVSMGAQRAESIVDLAEMVDVASIVVVTDDQVTSVGRELLKGMRPGGTIIIHSTVLPETVRALASEAFQRNVDVIDASVSGGSKAAGRGELVVMVGGPSGTIDRVGWAIQPLGRVVRVGAVGAGVTVKLINNMMQAAHHLFAFYAFEIGRALGIDEVTIVEAAMGGSGRSWSLENMDLLDEILIGHTLAGKEEHYDFLTKDAWNALLIGRRSGVHLPALGAMAESLHHAFKQRESHLRQLRSGEPVSGDV
jgi:3-hydroxyisobutyrate dehydrogenase